MAHPHPASLPVGTVPMLRGRLMGARVLSMEGSQVRLEVSVDLSRSMWTKDRYPNATYLGIADGAASNGSFPQEHTQEQVLDFYHVSYPKDVTQQKQ